MTRTLLALLLVALPVLSAGQSDTRIRKPEIRIGDSWTYRGTNILGPGIFEHESRVSFVDDDKVILLVSTRKGDGKEFDSSWTSEWNAVTSYTGSYFRPHTGFLRFPLRIGDTHELKYEFLRPRVNTILASATGTSKVVGWDMVEVPAGTFRAIKVEFEVEVKATDGSWAYKALGTIWYEPEVRRWVKFQTVSPNVKSSEELLAYKLNEN